jgi:excisionase family DNA binding protein
VTKIENSLHDGDPFEVPTVPSAEHGRTPDAMAVLARQSRCSHDGARARPVNVQSERISAILNKMERIVAIGEAADVLGVSIATLRRWEAAGKLAAEHTAGGHRRDDVAK